MARRLSNLDVLRQLLGVYWLNDTATTTTTAGTAAKGAKSLDLTDGSGLVAGDEFRIGDNGDQSEIVVIDTIVTNTVTPKLPLARAIASGEDVTLLSAVNVGATTRDGFQFNPSQSRDDLEVGTQLDAYLSTPGALVREIGFACQDFNAENLALYFGIDETDTAIVDANGITLNPDDFLTRGFQPWKFEGLLKGGESVVWYQFAAEVGAIAQAIQIAFGTNTSLPLSMVVAGNHSVLIE